MSNMTNIEIVQEISTRIGNEPIPFESVYSVAFDIYQELGGTSETFDDIYSILLQTLSLAENSRYEAGVNISIDSANTISALGYKYYPEQKSFKTVVPMNTSSLIEKYTEDGNDLGSGSESFVLGSRNKLNSGLSAIVGNGNSIETSVSSNFIFGKSNKIYGGNSAVAVGLTNYINDASTLTNALQYAIGSNLKVQNGFEGALGQYNVTHSGSTDASTTRFSIGSGKYGNGTGANGKIFENVIEVMRNGDTYIKGFGGYDGVHIKTETGYENTKTVQEYISALETTISSLEARITALENNNN